MLSLLLGLTAAVADPAPMPDFLTGCWTARIEDRWFEECWTRGNGGVMIGSARSWADAAVDQWEWMRIERSADGRLSFAASPKGAPQSAFPAISATASEVVFENRAHDYPQRIRYWKTDRGIAAEISLADGGKPVRFDFTPLGGPAEPGN
jgi:hypothetical protein